MAVRKMHETWLRTALSVTAAASVALSGVMLPALPVVAAGRGAAVAAGRGVPWAWAPGRIPLRYQLERIDEQTLRLTAQNPSKVPVNLVFRGLTHELIVRNRQGREVWRLSQETAAIAAIRVVKVSPGAALTYDLTIPDLEPGRYTAEAYLLAINAPGRRGGAKLEFEVGKTNPSQQVAYSLTAVRGADGQDYLTVAAQNGSDRPVELEARKGVLGEVELLNRSGRKVWSGAISLAEKRDSKLKLAAGEVRTWFVALPELTAGETYTARVTFDSGQQPHAQQRFVAGESQHGLRYTLEQTGQDGRLARLRVTNPTSQAISLTFPTGQQFDLALWQADGAAAWRWSSDKMFSQGQQTLKLNPGAELLFEAELPARLKLADYTLAAYLTTAGSSLPVAVSAGQPAATALRFDLKATREQAGTRAQLAVTNPGREPLTLRFPNGQQYDFILRDSQGAEVWRWSADRFFVDRVQELRLNPGATLQFEAVLPAGLKPGAYTLEGWLMAEGYRDRAVASQPLTVAATVAPLRYDLQAADERLAFTVTNPGQEAVNVRFPSGQQHDFIIKDSSGAEVWRWSADRFFVDRVQELRLNPGASLKYEAELPVGLAAGTYTVEAWFLAEGYGDAPAASRRITVKAQSGRTALAYQVEPVYDRGSLTAFQVTVTNTSHSRLDLEFPSEQHLEIKLRNRSGRVAWTWSDGEVFDVSRNAYSLAPGESREYLLGAADAPRGSYTLELYFPAEAKEPVHTQEFSHR